MPPSMHAVVTPPPTAPFLLTLPQFDGPLDLLLHLIQQHELSIAELPIAFITDRYLQYLQTMRAFDLDVASDYLVMAAKLAYLKSKSLLPPDRQSENDEDAGDGLEDPIASRAELIRRLLEYQKYKQAAADLAGKPLLGRDVFLRSVVVDASSPAPLLAPSVFSLLAALENVFARLDPRQAFIVTTERIGLQERMTQITERLQRCGSCEFSELFHEARSRYDVVITFLAVLEMGKMRLLSLFQLEPLGAIRLQAAA